MNGESGRGKVHFNGLALSEVKCESVSSEVLKSRVMFGWLAVLALVVPECNAVALSPKRQIR